MEVRAAEVEALVKVYKAPEGGELRAVDGISFWVDSKEIFGFLGPNGAGKTTTLEIIEGLRPATSGSVKVLGVDALSDPDGVKKRIGVQLQKDAFFKKLRLTELLDLLASFYRKPRRSEELLSRVGLTDKRKAQVKELSGGQARRFSIAAAMVNEPEIMFLDEPSSGLDPQSRRHLWDLIWQIREAGTTIVITTHHMEEAEALCDRVAIMDHGRIIAVDTPIGLVRSMDSAYHVRFATSSPIAREDLEMMPGVATINHSIRDGTQHYDVEVKDPSSILSALHDVLSGAGHVGDLRIEPSTLEDYFIAMTGRDLRD